MKSRKKEILKSKRFALALALSAVAALASGCGQQAYNENGGNQAGGNNGNLPQGGNGGLPGNGGGNPLPNPTPTATTTGTNASANYNFHFQMTGTGYGSQVGGGSLAAVTDSLLKISITTGNGMQIPGTGYTVGFNCEMFSIHVGNVTQTAFVKKQGYTDFMLLYGYMSYDPCQSAQTTWTGDFSGALAPGQRNVYINVNGAQYDNCRTFGDVYDGGCTISSVYSTHVVDGFMAVFTN